ncbi:hypothetical protein ACFE04_020722 [Oxalis oulophora]
MLTDKNLTKKLQDFNNIAKGDKQIQNHLLREKLPLAIIVKSQDLILVTVEGTKNLSKLAHFPKLRAKWTRFHILRPHIQSLFEFVLKKAMMTIKFVAPTTYGAKHVAFATGRHNIKNWEEMRSPPLVHSGFK